MSKLNVIRYVILFKFEDNVIVPHFIKDIFDDLRYNLYTKKNKTILSLPVTSNMSHGHNLRSYYIP